MQGGGSGRVKGREAQHEAARQKLRSFEASFITGKLKRAKRKLSKPAPVA